MQSKLQVCYSNRVLTTMVSSFEVDDYAKSLVDESDEVFVINLDTDEFMDPFDYAWRPVQTRQPQQIRDFIASDDPSDVQDDDDNEDTPEEVE